MPILIDRSEVADSGMRTEGRGMRVLPSVRYCQVYSSFLEVLAPVFCILLLEIAFNEAVVV